MEHSVSVFAGDGFEEPVSAVPGTVLEVPEFTRPVVAEGPARKFAVVFDMKDFDALEAESAEHFDGDEPISQKGEIYRLIRAYPHVRFVFLVSGQRQLDRHLATLQDLQQLGNVKISVDPLRLDVRGYDVVNVTREGIERDFAGLIENAADNDLYRVRYRASDRKAGLLTSALRLLVDLNRYDVFADGRVFSDVPAGWQHAINNFLAKYTAMMSSA